ncbi:MAG: arginine--tRNA ligase [Gammaproteobacteria bacterium]|nr:arginine--tRNA ligase [Gammaproteobacteria bacterium]
MKNHLQKLLQDALNTLQAQDELPANLNVTINIEHTKDRSHGDFASNLAMMLAKPARCAPRVVAEKLVAALPSSELVIKVDIAGPGFINFFLHNTAYHDIITRALQQDQSFGRSEQGHGQSIQVEFVSANPTGPLHVGHGRGAAYGAAVADLLEAVGYQVQREYYVNDAGRQMDILAASVYLRYLDLSGEEINFPDNGYQGDYVWDIAATLHRENNTKFAHPASDVFKDIAADEKDGGDKELHIDGLIQRIKDLLGADDYRLLFDLGLNTILDNIRQDLHEFGVDYQEWFSERRLTESGQVQAIIERLQEKDYIYEKNGALWFRSTAFGDEKDRVVVRDNGQSTYFASDIAYHINKLERGFSKIIDIWGADHHGYIPRVKAAMQAVGDNPDQLDVLLVQFAILYQGGERMKMSTRSGEFVTLRELRNEVGNDAARFFYVMRKCEQHLDFDLDLAKSQSNENPVYYIQYAHARIMSVMRQMEEKSWCWDQANGEKNLALLQEDHEQDLIIKLSRYPEAIELAATQYEPHQLAHFLRALAQDFHTYYNAHIFLTGDNPDLRDARLNLIQATRIALRNGLNLLGVSAPDKM